MAPVGSNWIILTFVCVAALQLQPRAHARSSGNITDTGVGTEEANYYPGCHYTFEVKTGDQHGAGTDSAIKLYMCGSDGHYTNYFYKEVSGRHHWYGDDRFEQGQLDHIDLHHWCAYPCAIRLESDGTGEWPNWYVEYVRVIVSGDLSDDQTFHFDTWIGQDQGYSATVDNCHGHGCHFHHLVTTA